MTVEELAMQLGALRVGKGKYVAKCPAHPDKTPSLSIAVGRKFPVVLKCMSQGCDTEAILQALGLRWSDVCGDRPLSPRESHRLTQDCLQREYEHRETRRLVHHALRRADWWNRKAQTIGAQLDEQEFLSAVPFHFALEKARRFEAIADMLDDEHCKGKGVPRCSKTLSTRRLITLNCKR